MKKTKNYETENGLIFKTRKDYHYYLKLVEAVEDGLIDNFDESSLVLAIKETLDEEPTLAIEDGETKEIEDKRAIASDSKFKSKKVVINEITFDSRLEADYYLHLLKKQRDGEIKSFSLKPTFELQPSFRKNGKLHRKISYIADFKVHHLDGTTQIVDTKGMITPDFAIKMKMFEYKFPELNLTLMKYVISMGGWIDLDSWKKLSKEKKRNNIKKKKLKKNK